MYSISLAKSVAKYILPERLVYIIQMRRIAAEERILPFITDRLEGGTAIDIGANTGVYSYYFSKKAQRTIAFEPIVSLAGRLARLNPSVEVHQCALSDMPGQLEIHIPYLAGAPVYTRASLNGDAVQGFQLKTKSVPVKRLDDFEFTNVRIIKIDVEGHERKTIAGALTTIDRWKPILVVEIEERHHPGEAKNITRWVESLGYHAFYAHEGKLKSAVTFDFATMQDVANIKTPFNKAEGEYINNFLFLPRD